MLPSYITLFCFLSSLVGAEFAYNIEPGDAKIGEHYVVEEYQLQTFHEALAKGVEDSPAAALDTLLGKRQSCRAGYGYCTCKLQQLFLPFPLLFLAPHSWTA